MTPSGPDAPRPRYESDPFIRTLREGVDAQLFAVDRDLRYVTFNLAHAAYMEAATGIRPVEGMIVTEPIVDDAGRAKLCADLHRALGGERHGAMGWWRPGRRAAELLESEFIPVCDDAGAVIGVAVVMRDRTVPSEREAAFQQLERRYRALLDSATDGIVVIRDDGGVVEANEAFAKLLGAGLEQVRAARFEDWHAGPRKEDARQGLRASLDHARQFETILRRYDGGYVPVEVSASPVSIDGVRAVLYAARDITERRRAESALAERKSRLRAIVDNAPFGVGVVDLVTGALVEANLALLAIYGRSSEELQGQRLGLHTHPEDQDTERQLLEEVARGVRSDYTLRKRNVRPDGSTVPVELRAIRLPDEPGGHPLVLGIATDLRNIAEAERSLRESEERYRRLADHAQDLIYRVRTRPHPTIEYVSPSVERLIGYRPDQLYDDSSLPLRLVHPKDRPMLEALLSGTIDLGEPRILRWIRPDTSVVWLEHRSTTVRGPTGEIEAIEGIGRDITASVARDEELHLVERALEQAREVVIISDLSGRIVRVNAAFERVTGHTRDEVVGLTTKVLQSGKQGPEFYEQMWKLLLAGEVFSADIVNRRKDGTYYDAEIAISPIRNAAGVVSHYVGIQRDVTAERARDAQLRQAQKMEAMGQVTGGIAHDFNNLLTVILATANLLETELPAGGSAVRWLRDLTEAAQQGALMVRQLLAFGRQEILSPRPTDLERVVIDFRTVLRRVLPETITLTPVSGSAPLAQADRTALEQVLLNLANNARDAMPGGGTLSFILGDRSDEESGKRFATLAVIDTGTGMTEETLRRCVEPFYTTKAVGKGTGLGLSMVHGLMHQLGGRVEITSAVGRGSTFLLHFPVATLQAVAPRPAAPKALGHRLNAHILLVEDNDALRRVAVRLLERAGCRVVATEDGEVAWERWQAGTETFDLVLTDAVMPRLGGLDLIARLRGAGSTVPIILMSGYSSESLSELQKHVLILAKPWTGEALLDRIREALSTAST